MFGSLDWAILAAYIGFTTLIGHRLRGRQHTTRDFFLGGRDQPWYAVAASSITTTISAVTFVGVPALVYAAGGNYAYLQLALGSILAKLLVARYVVPLYYEKEFYSPYEFMADRLGPVAGRITAAMFFLGGILGQGVRVYATALVLELVTGWSMSESMLLIAAFAVLWTWLGGIAAVIWTDFVQFFILVGGAVVALGWIVAGLPGGWEDLVTAGRSAGKFALFDFSTDPRIAFTFWAAIIAMPFQNLSAYGTDQLNAQRILCCRGPRDARKAVLWSIWGEAVVVLMLTVGVGLFAYYQHAGLTPELADLVAGRGDRIFPVFILSELPTGLRGLLIAAIVAAAISSLDSILAALAQTSVTMFYRPYVDPGATEDRLLVVSRVFVLAWGIVLACMAWLLSTSDADLVTLALSMTTYTYGPMLGVFLLSVVAARCRVRGIRRSVAISVLVVLLLNEPRLLNPLLGTAYAEPALAWPWLFPIGTLCCFLGAFGGPRGKEPATA